MSVRIASMVFEEEARISSIPANMIGWRNSCSEYSGRGRWNVPTRDESRAVSASYFARTCPACAKGHTRVLRMHCAY